MSLRPLTATSRMRVRCEVGLLLLAVVGSCAIAASAQSPPSGGNLVPAFSIAKSENKNQVQYMVRVDDHCAPVGPAPMTAYWRMLESGPTRTAPILTREVRAYGLASQVVVASDGSGGQVRAVLKALPSRPLTIATSRGTGGTCRAVVTASIAGAPAHFFNVYVHLTWYGVDYLLLQGWALDGSHVIRETIKK
jgi:hypothetical protein